MPLEQIPGAILLTLIAILIAMGLWYLGLRFRSLKTRQAAVMVALLPVLGIGVQLGSTWLGVGRPIEFHDGAAGPPSREASVVREGPFPVNDASVRHRLELTPEIRGGDPPTKPVRLGFTVRSPKGEILAQGESELSPAKGLHWAPLRAEFQPKEEGEHSLKLEIFNPASSVDIRIRELRP
jgi:hypothetical protein